MGLLQDFILYPIVIVTGVGVAWGMTNLVVGAGVTFIRSTASNGPSLSLPNTSRSMR